MHQPRSMCTLHQFTAEQKARYWACASGRFMETGFDVRRGYEPPAIPNSVHPYRCTETVPLPQKDYPLVERFANWAIEHHNRETGENLSLLKILKCDMKTLAGSLLYYYITFKAKDATTGGPSLVYQAKLKTNIAPFRDLVLYVRPLPKAKARSGIKLRSKIKIKFAR